MKECNNIIKNFYFNFLKILYHTCMHKIKNFLLTGIPGIGKTTIIKKIIEEFRNKCEGFWTEEMKENNKRRGFVLKTTTGKECILANIDFPRIYSVGKYGVNLKCIEEIGCETILSGMKEKKIIIIDEIGKMEILSGKFKELVTEILNSSNIVIATILYSPHPFCDSIKNREDVKIYKIDYSNRDYITNYIIEDLRKLKFF